MMARLHVLFLLVICALIASIDAIGYIYKKLPVEWSYTGLSGPSHWCRIGYNVCCESKQSPINFNTKQTVSIANHLEMKGYRQTPTAISLINNGETVRLSLTSKKPPYLTISGIRVKYVLDNIHFHWGANSSVGSEHTVDGKRYPMEAHFVHRDSKYKNSDDASLHPDGIVVVSAFYKIGKRDNSHLSNLLRDVKHVRYAEDTYNDTTPFSVYRLLPNNGGSYFSYNGSFTTPPCTQSVRWFVFQNQVQISEKQIQGFRLLQTRRKAFDPAKNHPLVNNFRPIQPLNGRRVTLAKLNKLK